MPPRKRKLPASECSEQEIKPGDVQCDVCTGPKLKAVKSCLVCLSSFCESHLQPHLTVSGMKRHQLMEPVDNLEERVCPKHQNPLQLFCCTDQSCVCTMCVLLEHKNHECVSLEEACERRKASLMNFQPQSQNMVELRRLKVQEIKAALELSETENHKEVSVGLQVFTTLMQAVQRRCDQFLEQLQAIQKNNQKQAEELLQQLEQEICELEKRSTEAKQIALSTDLLHFLQHCPALLPAGLKDWSNKSFEPQTCAGSAACALSELEGSLLQEFTKASRDELTRVQQFAVDVTLDPDTAHPKLILSKDLKQVHHSDQKRVLPDNPRRFSLCCCVVGRQSFSSGRFYFEVQVRDKTEWDLGVVRESIDRKGKIALKPRNGQWVIWLRGGSEYRALAGRPVELFLRRPPQKIGVFVDYKAGLVSFYDVDSAELIYCFTDCSFEEKLLPYFSPCNNDRGKNSSALVLTTVTKPETVKSEPMDQKTASIESIKHEGQL